MSLLAPIFLIATPLLALPVLLHFYRGRKPDAVEWGAMHFLVDAVNEGRRWEKLEELLLMLLRVLALAALVFALARPMAPGQWLGASARQDVVLILDDSLSTAAQTQPGDGDGDPVIDVIKRSAHELIDKLRGDDHVQMLAASAGGRWLTADSIAATADGRRRLHELVDGLSPTQGDADLIACLRAAQRLATSEESTAQKTWLFTDGQRRSLRPDSEIVWKDLAQSIKDRELPAGLQIVLCGADQAPADNLAIGSVEAASATLQENGQAELTAVIHNLGVQDTDPLTIKWFLDDEEMAASKVAPIAAGSEVTTRAGFRVKKPGVHVVRCVIDAEDSLPLDQSAELVLRVAKKTPVLIVERTRGVEPGELSDGQLLMAALGYGSQENEDREADQGSETWRADFQPETIDASRMSDAELARFAAVIITAPDELQRPDIDRLASYVSAGGGVWVALGEDVEVDRFNALWHDDGEGLCPVALEGLSVDELGAASSAVRGGDDPGLTIHPPSADHPATRHLANTTGLDIDKARLEQHWRLARETPLGEPASVLLQSGSGLPLAVERYLGQGRVIVQAAPLGFEWSNLPRLKAYVVMINDWLAYLSTASRDRHNLSPGAPIVVQAPEDDRVVLALVTTPTGGEVELAGRGAVTNTVFRYTQTAMPGMYHVAFQAGGETIEELPYNAAREVEESDLARVTDDEINQITEWSGASFGAEPDLNVTAEGQPVSRQPVWWALLLSLAALMIGELVLASHVARRRSPPLVARG